MTRTTPVGSHGPAVHASSALVAVGHLLVAAAALVLGVVLVWAGTRPEAGLEGLFTIPGLALGAVGLVFGAAAVAVARATPHDARRAATLSRGLGLAEVVAGMVCGWGAAVSIASYGEFSPWRSPALVPAVVLLAVGVTAVVQASRTMRTM